MKLRTPMPPLKGEEVILNGQNLERPKKGKLTLIYFWSISCNQCEQSLVKLGQLEQVFQNQLNIMTVHMPRGKKDKEIHSIKAKVEGLHFQFPVFVDSHLKISDAFQNRFVPAFYLFDQEGLLRFYTSGIITMKLLEQRINRILK